VPSVPKNGTLVKMLTELTIIKFSINGSHISTLELMFVDIFIIQKFFENSGTNGLNDLESR